MDTIGIVRRLLDSGMDFALYRFPEETEPHLVLQKNGRAKILSSQDTMSSNSHRMHRSFSVDGSANYSGFVFAPFTNTERVPTLLIRPDVAVTGWELINAETQNLDKSRSTLSNIPLESKHGDIDESDSYKTAFRSFKNQLDKEDFQKLVLSYSQFTDWEYSGHEDKLYNIALENFPQSMVYLVYTQCGGRWFGCTPELLLEGYGVKWRTMALAGTRTIAAGITPATENISWGEKETHEQQLVSDYIEGQLQTLNARVIRKGPYTAQAANLLHLRTDFIFHTPAPKNPLDILDLLHPTPALCGLPKQEAWNFIRLFERNQRMYYGGYLGPLNLYAETNIYVNIRCCNIRPSGKAIFFAGGGLTKDSNFSSEKEEVKAKLKTIKNLPQPLQRRGD